MSYTYRSDVHTFAIDPGTVIEERDTWTLVVNRNQDLLGKVMVVLNRSCQDVRFLTPAEWSSLQDELRRVTSALDALFQPDHYNFAFLMNVDKQIHLHVIPRYAQRRTWNDLDFHDPNFGDAAGTDVRRLSPTSLVTLAEAIRESLPKPEERT